MTPAFPAGAARRWLEELRRIEQEFPDAKLLGPSGPLEGSLPLESGPRRYRLVWPPDYPARPPNIWELDDSGAHVDHRPDGHAFADESVCLFGHTPEHGWTPDLMAADALARLRRFVEAADLSEFPRVDAAPIELPHFRISIPPRLMDALRANTGFGGMQGRRREDGSLWLVEEVDRTGEAGIVFGLHAEEASPGWRSSLELTERWMGVWCRVDASLGDEPPSRERFTTWLETRVPREAKTLLEQAPAILLISDDGACFVWMHPPEAHTALFGARVPYVAPVVESIPDKVFLRTDARMTNALALRRANVAIVGAGSLGGSIGLALAKAGVGRFVLFDPERLEAENVTRHVCSLGDVGRYKVDAVARAIRGANPDAEVTPVRAALSLDPSGWYADAMAHLQTVLADPLGLVVCATATDHLERAVNWLCIAESTPAVYCAVLGDADHGRVFRVLPGVSPCYACVLTAQARQPSTFLRFVRADLGTPRYPDGGMPGLGIDVQEVAMLTARLVLQTLSLRVTGGVGYPEAAADHILWSARGDWAVDGPLQTRAERYPRDPDCPVCGRPRGAELEESEQSELHERMRRLSLASGEEHGG